MKWMSSTTPAAIVATYSLMVLLAGCQGKTVNDELVVTNETASSAKIYDGLILLDEVPAGETKTIQLFRGGLEGFGADGSTFTGLNVEAGKATMTLTAHSDDGSQHSRLLKSAELYEGAPFLWRKPKWVIK